MNTIVLNTGQQMFITTDLSKIFIWNNTYRSYTYTNSTGAEVTLLAGRLMGRVGATQKVLPLASAAVDGSQIPVGILCDNYVVADGVTITVGVCVTGQVVKNKVILSGADTMATLVSARSIEDRIGSDTVGINLIESTENSEPDNV